MLTTARWAVWAVVTVALTTASAQAPSRPGSAAPPPATPAINVPPAAPEQDGAPQDECPIPILLVQDASNIRSGLEAGNAVEWSMPPGSELVPLPPSESTLRVPCRAGKRAIAHFLLRPSIRLNVDGIADVARIVGVLSRWANARAIDVMAVGRAGLLVRAYVQSEKYRGDIRRVAFLGTPHRGVRSDVRYSFGTREPCETSLPPLQNAALRDFGERVRADSTAIADLNIGGGSFRPWPTGLTIFNVVVRYAETYGAACRNQFPSEKDDLRATGQPQDFPSGALSAPALLPQVRTVDGLIPFSLTGQHVAFALATFLDPVESRPTTQHVARDAVLVDADTGSDVPELTLRSLCPLGSSACDDSLPHTVLRVAADPPLVATFAPLRSLVPVAVRTFPRPGTEAPTRTMVILATTAQNDVTSAFVLNADATALLHLRPRPGVFRLRDILEERADLCVQGEGERRLLSLSNYCRATLRTPLPPLADWEIIRADNVTAAPSDSTDGISRAAGFRVTAGGRFDLRLRSAPSYVPLDSIARIEVEFTGPLEEDSVRVRVGWVDAETNVYWSDGATVANRVRASPPRPYGRFEIDIPELLRNTGMEGASTGRLSLLLHIRGVTSASQDEFRLSLTAVSASGGAASPRP